MADNRRTRPAAEDEQPRLAVLIDADNAQPAVIDGLLSEVARFGVASVRRIYGDWTTSANNAWKQSLLKHSLSPVQQFAYTRGKNATDSALIIDAMDLMYTGRFDGFCLVSSDSDFTRLAQRLREEGLLVYGFGERKTPEPFVVACDKFIYTELLRPEPEPAKQAPARKAAGKAAVAKAGGAAGKPPAPAKGDAGVPLALLRQAVEDAADDDGWANLGAVGSYLTKVRPDFDPRLYGHKKLSDLLRSVAALELREVAQGDGAGKVFSVRLRRDGGK